MIGSLPFLAACQIDLDRANYVVLGVCIGILSTAGLLVFFLEQWLRIVIRIGKDELRDQRDGAELGGLKLVPPSSEPETRR